MIPLFSEPIRLRGLEIPNRLFMSPMCQYSAVDGIPDDWHMRHYVERAMGGVGLLTLEATAVSPEGRITPADLGLWSNAHRDAFKPLVEAIHRAGARVGVQLAHAGRKASTAVPWLGTGRVVESQGGWATVAPSAESFDDSHTTPTALGREGIDRIVAAFGDAARRAVEAGCDTVEIHAAHGYLIHQFLSPLSNKRTDDYGGSLEGRSRLAREVVNAVRSRLPDSMPLLIRVSATDWIAGGWDVDECASLLRDVSARGVDFIDVSSGGLAPGARMPVGPGYQVGLAARIRAATGLPTGAVGLITTAEQIEQIMLSGAADAVSLGRLLLRDPYWPSRNLPAETRKIPNQYIRAYR
ncbi:MAG TPA: NADH:flavin oxidoreductase/NADH oxidase [bacterium]|nr:NADH:flavin oxidoreductase/NADH oxidase [bacterium]